MQRHGDAHARPFDRTTSSAVRQPGDRVIHRRRILLIAIGAGALAAPFTALAQQKQRIYRIGILASGGSKLVGHLVEAFIQGLRELGYVEGKNLLIDRRFGENNLERLRALAADLVRRRVDIILVAGTIAAQPAKQATSTIPIVFCNVHDPVGMGLVANLARPGGNMTGISNLAPELSAKRLELLKEAFPKTSRVAVIVSSEAATAIQFAEVQVAAKALGVETIPVEMQRRDDFERAITRLREWRVNALFVIQTPTHFQNRKLLAEIAAKMRVPSVSSSEEFAEVGHVISYGPHLQTLYRHAASFVDKILKGAKPAELPVEQPTTFELVINVKAAKALGLTIPQSILLRADRVIE